MTGQARKRHSYGATRHSKRNAFDTYPSMAPIVFGLGDDGPYESGQNVQWGFIVNSRKDKTRKGYSSSSLKIKQMKADGLLSDTNNHETKQTYEESTEKEKIRPTKSVTASDGKSPYRQRPPIIVDDFSTACDDKGQPIPIKKPTKPLTIRKFLGPLEPYESKIKVTRPLMDYQDFNYTGFTKPHNHYQKHINTFDDIVLEPQPDGLPAPLYPDDMKHKKSFSNSSSDYLRTNTINNIDVSEFVPATTRNGVVGKRHIPLPTWVSPLYTSYGIGDAYGVNGPFYRDPPENITKEEKIFKTNAEPKSKHEQSLFQKIFELFSRKNVKGKIQQHHVAAKRVGQGDEVKAAETASSPMSSKSVSLKTASEKTEGNRKTVSRLEGNDNSSEVNRKIQIDTSGAAAGESAAGTAADTAGDSSNVAGDKNDTANIDRGVVSRPLSKDSPKNALNNNQKVESDIGRNRQRIRKLIQKCLETFSKKNPKEKITQPRDTAKRTGQGIEATRSPPMSSKSVSLKARAGKTERDSADANASDAEGESAKKTVTPYTSDVAGDKKDTANIDSGVAAGHFPKDQPNNTLNKKETVETNAEPNRKRIQKLIRKILDVFSKKTAKEKIPQPRDASKGTTQGIEAKAADATSPPTSSQKVSLMAGSVKTEGNNKTVSRLDGNDNPNEVNRKHQIDTSSNVDGESAPGAATDTAGDAARGATTVNTSNVDGDKKDTDKTDGGAVAGPYSNDTPGEKMTGKQTFETNTGSNRHTIRKLIQKFFDLFSRKNAKEKVPQPHNDAKGTGHGIQGNTETTVSRPASDDTSTEANRKHHIDTSGDAVGDVILDATDANAGDAASKETSDSVAIDTSTATGDTANAAAAKDISEAAADATVDTSRDTAGETASDAAVDVAADAISDIASDVTPIISSENVDMDKRRIEQGEKNKQTSKKGSDAVDGDATSDENITFDNADSIDNETTDENKVTPIVSSENVNIDKRRLGKNKQTSKKGSDAFDEMSFLKSELRQLNDDKKEDPETQDSQIMNLTPIPESNLSDNENSEDSKKTLSTISENLNEEKTNSKEIDEFRIPTRQSSYAGDNIIIEDPDLELEKKSMNEEKTQMPLKQTDEYASPQQRENTLLPSELSRTSVDISHVPQKGSIGNGKKISVDSKITNLDPKAGSVSDETKTKEDNKKNIISKLAHYLHEDKKSSKEKDKVIIPSKFSSKPSDTSGERDNEKKTMTSKGGVTMIWDPEPDNASIASNKGQKEKSDQNTPTQNSVSHHSNIDVEGSNKSD